MLSVWLTVKDLVFAFRLLPAILITALICGADALAQAAPGASYRTILAPPSQAGPIEVRFEFDLYGVNSIDSVAETFELTGDMTLTWHDPRAAFDPVVEGVSEKLYQGDFQFNELAPGWYPQVVLFNESGVYESRGVQLRVKPDGTTVLKERIYAVAEALLDMRRFPFDSHRLEAVFGVLGATGDDVVLRAQAGAQDSAKLVRIPGWTFDGVSLTVPEGATRSGAVSLSIDVTRQASYIRRLITFPMFVIVLLSLSIFWMDKSSLGERNSVSFIGVLTGVAFQHIVVSVMPPVTYVTLMHGFLFMSFLVMAATVPVNIAVATLDKNGRSDLGDLVDQRCRWLFPLAYLAMVAMLGVLALR